LLSNQSAAEVVVFEPTSAERLVEAADLLELPRDARPDTEAH